MKTIRVEYKENAQVKAKTIAYWIFTAMVSVQIIMGAILDFSNNVNFKLTLSHLGYPKYLLPILGAYRIAALIVILSPKMPRIKEWMYAGVFAELVIAVISHMAVSDPAGKWIPALSFAFITFASWYLRPANRKLLVSNN